MDEGVDYRDVPSDSGYRIGDDGSAWSCFNRGGSGAGCRKPCDRWHRLKEHPAKGGYLRVRLRSGLRMVHHLVLEAFVGPCPPGMEACHRDDDPSNNRLTNLRWDTHRANIADRDQRGRTARGSRSGGAKLKEEQIPIIRSLAAAGHTQRQIASIFEIGHTTVYEVLEGNHWRHVGG